MNIETTKGQYYQAQKTLRRAKKGNAPYTPTELGWEGGLFSASEINLAVATRGAASKVKDAVQERELASTFSSQTHM